MAEQNNKKNEEELKEQLEEIFDSELSRTG